MSFPIANVTSPSLSPSLDEDSNAILVDESLNKLELVAAVQVDAAGHSNLGSAVLAASYVSQVTDRAQGAKVNCPGSKSIKLMGLVSLDSSGNPVPFKLASKFQSTVQTGTGSSQNVAHGLGVVPSLVLVSIYNTNGVALPFAISEGAHDATNIKVTVTNNVMFKVIALA